LGAMPHLYIDRIDRVRYASISKTPRFLYYVLLCVQLFSHSPEIFHFTLPLPVV
jgi:hypothetical protein